MTAISRTAGLGALGALGLALAVAPAATAAPEAPAHNSIVLTVPAADETLTELPGSFEIRTNDALLDLGGEGEGFALAVQDAAGLYYGDGCVRVLGPSMFSTAALGEPGPYTVTWQLVSADGHTLSGSYGFEWAPQEAVAPSAGSSGRPVCGAAAPEPEETAGEPGEGAPAGGVAPWIPATIAAVVLLLMGGGTAIGVAAGRRRRDS